MSDYTGPGIYEILPKYVPEMSVNVWGGATTAGTSVKLYPRTTAAKNTHFAIVAAGGTQGKPEKGDREYFIIAVHSGLYVAANEKAQVTTELRPALDGSIRWKLQHAGDGAFYINNVGNGKQLAVSGAAKESGTEILTWALHDNADHFKFLIKAV